MPVIIKIFSEGNKPDEHTVNSGRGNDFTQMKERAKQKVQWFAAAFYIGLVAYAVLSCYFAKAWFRLLIASLLSFYQVVLIVLSVSRLSKLIEGIQVAWYSKVKPDRFKVNAIIAVYMAKFVTYLLCSVLIVVSILVNNSNNGHGCLVWPFADFSYAIVWLADLCTICVSGFFTVRLSKESNEA